MKKNLKLIFRIVMLLIAIAGCKQSNNKIVNADGSSEKRDGGFIVAELAAVKIKMADESIMYYTHDTKNQKLRVDVSNSIILMDYKNKNMSVYAGVWMNIPWNSGNASEDYFDRTSEDKILEQGYQKIGTTTLLGKLCDVYSVTHTDTNTQTTFAIWNGITMRMEEKGKVVYEVLAVTLDVPSNFFEQTTIECTWIE